MSATITIEINDAGEATVSVDGGEPHKCGGVDECLEYLSDMLKGEEAGEPEQAAEKAEPDAQAMWDAEAENRAKQRQLMA